MIPSVQHDERGRGGVSAADEREGENKEKRHDEVCDWQ